MYELPDAPAVSPAPAECRQAMTPTESLWSARIRNLITEYQNEAQSPGLIPFRLAG